MYTRTRYGSGYVTAEQTDGPSSLIARLWHPLLFDASEKWEAMKIHLADTMHKGKMSSRPQSGQLAAWRKGSAAFDLCMWSQRHHKIIHPFKKYPAGYPVSVTIWKNSKKSSYLQSKVQWLINVQTPVRLLKHHCAIVWGQSPPPPHPIFPSLWHIRYRQP